MTGPAGAALDLFDRAVAEFQCLRGEPLATLDAALAMAPDFGMAQLLKAHFLQLSTDVAALPAAAACAATAAAAPLDEREALHLAAVRLIQDGHFHRGRDLLDDILIHHPRDAVALQVAHLWDFFLGDARSLRDRVARVLPAWSEAIPGYHAVLGMYAFGLEETADYVRAEALGRHALALEPRDAWARHAVAHVFEMQGRNEEGIAWLEAAVGADDLLAAHTGWHLALFHLDRGDEEAALAVYDGPVRGSRTTLPLPLCDASSLLWRLHLRGVACGRRWDELVDAWAPTAEISHYAFNNVHAMMAFVAAGRDDLAETTLTALARRAVEPGSNGTMAGLVGFPVARALAAFGRGDHAETGRILRQVRLDAHRMGGSHAQRDVLDLTMVEAALRQGGPDLARALTAERAALKPRSPFNQTLSRRAARLRKVID